jgi:hypothetical protein
VQRFFRAGGAGNCTLRLAANVSKCVDLYGCDTSAGVMDVWSCHEPGDGTACGGAFPSDPPANQIFDTSRADGTLRYAHDERFCLASTPEGAVQLLPCSSGAASQQWVLVTDGAAVRIQRGDGSACVSVG